MSDVKVAVYLLAHHAPLTAVVPVANIAGGTLPQGTPLPAICVHHIVGTSDSYIAKTGDVRTARVQVTVMAANYPQQKQLIALVRKAFPRTRGTVNGVAVQSVTHGPEGPDFSDDEVGMFMQTHDFFIRYVEP